MPQNSARNLINLAAEKLHTACLSFAPDSPQQELYQSFVCGAPLTDPTFSTLFTQSGLIHVVVVSGAHLVFLEVLLSLVDPRGRVTLPVLGFYSLVTGFNAPVARSLTQLILAKVSQKFQLYWSGPLLTLLAGALTFFVLGPSISLSLSWLASLALHASRSSPFKTQLRIYFFLFPALAILAPAHPLSIVINVLFVPLLSILAFPLSLLCFAFPPLSQLMDPFWAAFQDILQHIGQEVELKSPAVWTTGPWMALYVVILQIAVLFFHTWQKRRTWSY